MYNKLLDTFLAVADCGSFSKAAERLHISSTAVVKQIDQLENDISVRLFRRTPRGAALTEAGRAFQSESKKLICSADEAIQRVRQIEDRSAGQVRMGTSTLRPARYFLHLWSQICGSSLGHRIHIVPFLDNSYLDYMEVVRGLGHSIDVIPSAFPPDLSRHCCNGLEITYLPFSCAIPSEHRLANQQSLELHDLHGERLMILEPGVSEAVDEARAELMKHPEIMLIDTPDYEPTTFNQCEATGHLLLTLDCWADAHPMLKTIPINWSCGTSYGLLYPLKPSPEIQQFIDHISRSLKNAKRHLL